MALSLEGRQAQGKTRDQSRAVQDKGQALDRVRAQEEWQGQGWPRIVRGHQERVQIRGSSSSTGD